MGIRGTHAIGAWSDGSHGSSGRAHETAGLLYQADCGYVLSTVLRWPLARLGGQGLVGRDGKMKARKDGLDAVGSCLARPTLTAS